MGSFWGSFLGTAYAPLYANAIAAVANAVIIYSCCVGRKINGNTSTFNEAESKKTS